MMLNVPEVSREEFLLTDLDDNDKLELLDQQGQSNSNHSLRVCSAYDIEMFNQIEKACRDSTHNVFVTVLSAMGRSAVQAFRLQPKPPT